MAIEAVGPLTRGPLSVFQDSEKQKQLELRVRLPRAGAESDDEEDEAAGEAAARRTRLPFNPHADALRTAQEIEHGRRIVAALESSPPLSLIRGKEEEEEDARRLERANAQLGKRVDVMA